MTTRSPDTIAARTTAPAHLDVVAFFEPVTETFTYVIREVGTRHCAIIDPVLEPMIRFPDPPTHAADEVISHVRGNDLAVDWILETHTWADHLSAAHYLKRWVGGRIAIAPRVPAALGGLGCLSYRTRGDSRAAPTSEGPKGPPFDHLFANGERFRVGGLEGIVLRPNEPPSQGPWTGYVIGDCAFLDDAAATDNFVAAAQHAHLDLSEQHRLFACHDPGRRRGAAS